METAAISLGDRSCSGFTDSACVYTCNVLSAEECKNIEDFNVATGHEELSARFQIAEGEAF